VIQRQSISCIWSIWLISSISFSEPDKPKKPNKPDEPTEPAPRHVPRNVGLQDLTLLEQEERVYLGSMVYSVKELSEAREKIQLPCP
jgi:hypothetical protein